MPERVSFKRQRLEISSSGEKSRLFNRETRLNTVDYRIGEIIRINNIQASPLLISIKWVQKD